jgi:tetratricopeptide (TPR) repeat protein
MRLKEYFDSSKSILIMLMTLVVMPLAMAQNGGQGGQTGGTSKPPPASPKAPPSTTRPDISVPSPDHRAPEAQLPDMIFLSGTVVLEDGTPPPMGTTIERDCNGFIKKEVYVDMSGNFNFQIGGDSFGRSPIPDASQGLYQDPFDRDLFGNGSRGAAFGSGSFASRLLGCEIRADLPGYRSTVFRLSDNGLIGHIDVGTIVLYPIERVQGTMESSKNLLAPKSAKKAFKKAKKAFEKEKFEEAESRLSSAIKVYPDYVDAWLLLGRTYQQQSRDEQAKEAYKKAIAADKLYVEPYIWLAQLHFKEGHWQEMADITDQAMELDPISYPLGHFFNGIAYYHLENLDRAEESAMRGIRLDSSHRIPQMHLLLANIFAKRRDREQSIKEMRKYLEFAPEGAEADEVRSKLEELKKQSDSASVKASPQ